MCRYAVYTADRVTAHGTVENYVGGIQHLQHLAGFPEVPPNSPNLKLIMQGLKAYLAKPTKQAEPITIDILSDISEIVDETNPFQVCAFSALLTGFYLVLRSSNLVPTSSNNFKGNEQFTRWHVGLDPDDKLALFVIEWSKTIQHCRKELWVPVMPSSDRGVCLIANLRRYFAIVPAHPTDPCFCFRNKTGQLKALTYDQLATQFKDWIKKIGLDQNVHTLHGIRRGGTSHAFNMGIKPEYIKMMGDWASNCFYCYLDIALEHRLKAVVKFAK